MRIAVKVSVVLAVSALSLGSFETRADTAQKPFSREQAVGATRQFNVRVPMRDGVTLSADIYRPNTSDRVPVVLIRTPYTKSVSRYAEEGQWWAEHGYAFVVQDTRGRGDSDGTFYPMIAEAKDGFDTLAWIGSQAWSNGRVGMTGISYLGVTQVYAASELSPFLKAIVPGFTPADPDRYWPTHFGVALLRTADWLAGLDGHTNQDRSSLDLDAAFRGAPLVELDARLGRNLPAWRDWVTHPPGSEYWRAQSYQEKLLRAKVPILHVTGWYDTVPFGNTENFINMSSRALDVPTRRQQHLLIGPWGHGMTANRKHGAIDFGTAAVIDFRGVQLRWFDRWLKEIDNGVDKEPRVRVFAMGANRWIEEDEWPIARTTYVKYYLRSKGRANSRLGDGQLSPTPPATESPDRFRYDPADPVPFMSPTHNPQWPEPEDFREVETRADVLVYSSEPVTEPTLVCGPLRVKLFAASSARDTDWTARVLDVWPDGFAQQLSYGIVRARFRTRGKEELLEPGKVYEYDIDVWSTCVELQKGHRARLEISSSAFPWFDRNLNTGGKFGLETHGVIAQQTVLHNRQHASYLLLPIVPRR